MKIGIPKESIDGEARVATTPEIARKLIGAGLEVLVERLTKDIERLFTDEDPFSEERMLANGSIDLPEPEQYLAELVRIAEEHGIRFPSDFTLLLKQFLYFEAFH